MLYCIQCGYCVRTHFHHFCRNCYRILVSMLEITNADFINYINRSFNINLTYPPYWRFKDMHNWLRCQFPSIKSLASVLESIIYLKMLLSTRPVFTPKLELVKFVY